MTLIKDRYRVVDTGRKGGQATLFKAFDEHDGVMVAVKKMIVSNANWTPAIEADVRRRFEQEASTLRDLPPSPHVVPFREAFPLKDELYLVTDWLEGPSLDQCLWERRRPRLEEVVRWSRGVCSALAHCHRNGVIHRDVKPGNIMIVDSQAVLVDFGIVRLEGNTTYTAFPVGTPSYMPPERWHGEPGDERSDLYAFGCVLYEMLAGEPPFRGELHDMEDKHLRGIPVPPGDLVNGVPPHLDLLALALLAKNPDSRPPTAADVLARLGPTPAAEATLALADQRLRLAERRYGPTHERTLEEHAKLAEHIGESGDTTGALHEYDRLLSLCERELDPFDPLPQKYRRARNRWSRGLR